MIKRRIKGKRERAYIAQSTKETNRPGPGRKPPVNIMHYACRQEDSTSSHHIPHRAKAANKKIRKTSL
jgi:hypothetical protein